MEAAQIIRKAVAEVKSLRESEADDPHLWSAVLSVKHYQSLRFQHSYRDMLDGGPFQLAARFFLDELYGVADFSKRDAQFSRIARAIERLLPASAVEIAVLLAKLHVLTEQLDHAMAKAWLTVPASTSKAERYILAWAMVGQQRLRLRQLQLVLEMGWGLDRLTRKPGLRKLLKIMRAPAAAAGLAELQHFLETGFDTFASIAKHKPGTAEFLRLIQIRETKLIAALSARPVNGTPAINEGLLPAESDICIGS